jgi:hypothetical protein
LTLARNRLQNGTASVVERHAKLLATFDEKPAKAAGAHLSSLS